MDGWMAAQATLPVVVVVVVVVVGIPAHREEPVCQPFPPSLYINEIPIGRKVGRIAHPFGRR